MVTRFHMGLIGKRLYTQALDLVTQEIKRRLQQPGMSIAAKREQVY